MTSVLGLVEEREGKHARAVVVEGCGHSAVVRGVGD